MKREVNLPPVRPNVGLEAQYRLRLAIALAAMHNSVLHWLGMAYRGNPPEAILAQDDLPSAELQRVIKDLAARWLGRFDELAKDLSAYFAVEVGKRADGALAGMLKRHGMSVKFKLTRPMRDALSAKTGQNVALIRSIAQKYFTDVEGAVLRAAAEGRDLATLTHELGPKVDLARIRLGRRPGETDKSLFARTYRRAAFIARDQSNKATAVLNRVRQDELGVEQAVWMHSGGGKEPRPEHERWGRERRRYDINKGMWSKVDKQYVWPGTAVNCHCTSRPIIPGLEAFAPKERLEV